MLISESLSLKSGDEITGSRMSGKKLDSRVLRATMTVLGQIDTKKVFIFQQNV